MSNHHINRSYAQELAQLQDRLLFMANRVEKMVSDSILALGKGDINLAKETIFYDRHVDREEMLIDEQCIEMLARRQPLGRDLRFIALVLKMVTYLERMGDLAVNICERVIKLKEKNQASQVNELEQMAQAVQSMIRLTFEAFVLRDAKKAIAVIRQDDAIDELYHSYVRDLVSQVGEENRFTETTMHLLAIAKWLERMGDHCTNLAELIIFMVKGEDVRHQQILEQNRTSLS